jgi:hypothetical protein
MIWRGDLLLVTTKTYKTKKKQLSTPQIKQIIRAKINVQMTDTNYYMQ